MAWLNKHRVALAFTAFWVFVAIVSHVDGENTARNAANVAYENSIAGCERNNPRWKAYTGVTEGATTSTNPQVRQKAKSGIKEIFEQPFINDDGTTDCQGAIKKP